MTLTVGSGTNGPLPVATCHTFLMCEGQKATTSKELSAWERTQASFSEGGGCGGKGRRGRRIKNGLRMEMDKSRQRSRRGTWQMRT